MKNGFGCILTGVCLFFAGAFAIPGAIVLTFLLNQSKPQQFLVPGSMEVEITEPGRYFLWNDYQTVFNGRTYNSPEALPHGLQITVTSKSGRPLAFLADGSTTASSGSSMRRSIGYVQMNQPDRLTVAVQGDAEARVFSFARSNMLRILGLIFGGMTASGLVALAGIVVSILGIVRLSQGSFHGSLPMPDRASDGAGGI